MRSKVRNFWNADHTNNLHNQLHQFLKKRVKSYGRVIHLAFSQLDSKHLNVWFGQFQKFHCVMKFSAVFQIRIFSRTTCQLNLSINALSHITIALINRINSKNIILKTFKINLIIVTNVLSTSPVGNLNALQWIILLPLTFNMCNTIIFNRVTGMPKYRVTVSIN